MPKEDSLEPIRGMKQAAPRTVLLVAIWIGLTAGFVDVGLLCLKNRLLDTDFYRLGDGFPWIIPTGVAVLVLIPGAILALVARLRRRGVSLGIAVGFLSFIGFLDSSAKLPLEFWASLLLSGGLAVQSARLVASRPGFLRLVRLTTPVLAATVLALMFATSGVRAWTEHRAVAALPPPPSGRRT